MAAPQLATQAGRKSPRTDHADRAGDGKFNPLVLDEIQTGADTGKETGARVRKATKQGCGTAIVLVRLDGHPPATAASVASTTNVTATPISIGNPLLMNGRSARTHKRQHRQDSGADDGQHIAEIGQ
jgi:hypothetical protein